MKRLIHGAGFPFVAPFLLFMGLLYFRQSLPTQEWWLYGVSSLLVLGLLLWLRPRYRGQDPANPRTLHSILLGLGAIILWIALDPWMPRSGERNNAFPFAAAFEVGLIPGVLSILFRALGAVLIVPVVEELFWRGFLMRTIIKPEFEEVPLGTFQPLSFYITTLVFAAVHAEWGSAVLFGLIAGAWFCHTKSLRSVILLHAAANLGLTIYVLVSRQWFFW